ncbi:MAG TPA: CDP-alcohol phosphatidyltransferase family protein [Candidatus Binataceae bacterium]|nr:CDP-alcohol phosphatidyltransferase family protein [Candidatus Binataceae bacterium]
MAVEWALIEYPGPEAVISIYGRELFERLVLVCRQVGMSRFAIASSESQRVRIEQTLARLGVVNATVVGSFDELSGHNLHLDSSTPVLVISGSLVFARTQLLRILNAHQTKPDTVLCWRGPGGPRRGEICVGPLARIFVPGTEYVDITPVVTSGSMPIALGSKPGEAEAAEIALAHCIKDETVARDALLARLIDRRWSWRLSSVLARTSVVPNQVTIANTMLGCVSAVLFAQTSYWSRLGASLLFVLVTTLDGVDGELARLKLLESDFGAALDITTDVAVNFAVLVGIFVGCYRSNTRHVPAFCLALFVGGYLLCAAVSYWAYATSRSSQELSRFDALLEQLTSRDFAYLLVVFALFGRMDYVAWGCAAGPYVVASILLWSIVRLRQSAAMDLNASRHDQAVTVADARRSGHPKQPRQIVHGRTDR